MAYNSTEDRRQRTESICHLTSDFCFLFSVFCFLFSDFWVADWVMCKRSFLLLLAPLEAPTSRGQTPGVLLLTGLALLLAAGCVGSKPRFTEEEVALIPFPQRKGLPEASGGLVLVVGGETITSNEIVLPLVEPFREFAQSTDIKRFKKWAKPKLEELLTTRISNILLYNQAKRQAGENIDEALEKVVEKKVREFIVSYENDYAKAEQALKDMGMNWASFKEYQKKMILSQSYIASQLPEQRPITYSELVDYYNKMKDESFVIQARLKLQLIDIQPEKLELADPNQSRLEQARELANELLGRLQSGEDFGELAKQYSHGHRREFGGLWKPVQPRSLAVPYDILAAEAERIEPGQIAGPIEAGEHIFIMKLVEKRPRSVEPFEKVQDQVEAKIISDRWEKAINELNAKLVQQATIGERDTFIDFCLEEIHRLSNQ